MTEIYKPDALLAKLLPPQKPRPGAVYVPSQFALPFERNGKRYVFQTMTKRCVEAELPATARAGGEYDGLIEGGFLVPEGKDECAYYCSVSAMLRTYAGKKGIPAYTVLPTVGCNARCVYCYEEGRDRITMSPETVEQTIRFILNTHAEGTVRLSWFGGEPLLCTEIIDRVSEALREADLPFRASLISNGSQISPKIVGKMKDCWNVGRVQISMDGAEEEYAARKRYFRYEDTYRRVMEGIGLMAEAGIRVNVRCNVDFGNWHTVPRFLDDLSAGIARKENVGVYFAPLNDVRAGENDLGLWKRIAEAGPLIEAAGFASSGFGGPSMKFRVNRCMADGGSAVITPDGGVWACEHCPPEARFGDIWNGVTDEAARKAFCRTDRIREKCRTCPFLPDCTGFASCPITDAHCREARELVAREVLGRMADRYREKGAEEEEESADC